MLADIFGLSTAACNQTPYVHEEVMQLTVTSILAHYYFRVKHLPTHFSSDSMRNPPLAYHLKRTNPSLYLLFFLDQSHDFLPPLRL